MINISFFLKDANIEEIEIGNLLKKKFKVNFNKIENDTEIVFVMGCMAWNDYINYIKRRYELERFIYQGKLIPQVFDVPEWRLENEHWKNYYNNYRMFLKKADYIVTNSKTTSKQLKRLWNIESIPLFKEFNNIGVENVPKQKKENQIISISRFVPHKRFELLIYVLELMDNPPKLVIIGRGPLKQFYLDMAKQRNVDMVIYENASYEKLYKELKKSKLCVLPSIFEGKNMVAKEAIWADVPVILSDIDANREFHKNVIFFRPDDPKDLKKKIEENLDKEIDLKLAKKEIECLTIQNVTKDVERFINDISP